MKKAVHLSSMTISSASDFKTFSFKTVLTFLSMTACAYSADDNTFDYPVGYGMTLSPAIEISTRHDDNIFLQDKIAVKSSWITELAPSLLLSAQQGVNLYTAQYTLKAGRYHSSRNDDYVDHLLELDSHNEFNQRNQLDLSFDYLHLHEDRGTGLSDTIGGVSKTPDEYDDMFLSGVYTYGSKNSTGRIEIAGSYLDREYSNNRDKTRYYDRNEDEIGATFFYRVMPKTSLLFEAKFKDIDYDNDFISAPKLDGDEATYQAGVEWEATAKTTGRAQIGQTYKDFDASERKKSNFTSWEVGVEWAPLTYSVLDFRTSSEPSETNGSGNYIETKTVAVSWLHAWSERLNSTVQGSYISEDYDEARRDDDTQDYTVGLDYQFRRGIAFGVDYTYSTRDSNSIGQDYDDNVFMLSTKIGM